MVVEEHTLSWAPEWHHYTILVRNDVEVGGEYVFTLFRQSQNYPSLITTDEEGVLARGGIFYPNRF